MSHSNGGLEHHRRRRVHSRLHDSPIIEKAFYKKIVRYSAIIFVLNEKLADCRSFIPATTWSLSRTSTHKKIYHHHGLKPVTRKIFPTKIKPSIFHRWKRYQRWPVGNNGSLKILKLSPTLQWFILQHATRCTSLTNCQGILTTL